MKRILLVSFLSIFTLASFAQNSGQKKPNVRLIRNATIVINYAGHKILVDPMFTPKGALGSIAGKLESPTVDLPMAIGEITENVNLILLTHNHPDHIDKYATDALDKSIKFFVQPEDKQLPVQAGFSNAEAINKSVNWQGISITRTIAEHGTGRVLKEMGPGSGYVLQAANQPTIYIVGDAVWTQEIYQNIATYKPDYIILNSGGAAMPGFEATPIIMDADQAMSLIQESGSAKVIAVHMDAIDHCHTTREVLKAKAKEYNIGSDKLITPADGEVIEL